MSSAAANSRNKQPEVRGATSATQFALQHTLLDTLFDAVFTVDRERRITYWSPAAEQLTGYTAAEAVGRLCQDDFLLHMDQADCLLCSNECPFTPAIEKGWRSEREVSLRHKDGHRIAVNIRVAPVYEKDQIVGAIQVFRDLTSVKAVERRAMELEQLAFRDFLTGMPNRRYTDHKVQQAIDDRRHFGRAYGLLMIDLDAFKRINDTHGHLAGDALLQAIGRALALGLRSNDMVGRWGGEELLVLAADATPNVLAYLAERCRAIVADCVVNWNGQQVNVTASVGATLVDENDTHSSAVDRADALMYRSKKNGGNCITLDKRLG
jgi:diguanylate cyclase (GGDEF)-like protein/PAS domain S-box-containing protein